MQEEKRNSTKSVKKWNNQGGSGATYWQVYAYEDAIPNLAAR